MPFFSKSSSDTSTDIKLADNKSNNNVSDQAENFLISDVSGSNVIRADKGNANLVSVKGGYVSIVNEEFNTEFGLSAIEQTLASVKENLRESLNFTNGAVDDLILAQREQIRDNNALVNASIESQNSLLDKLSETPDERLEGIVKMTVVGALLFGGVVVYKGL